MALAEGEPTPKRTIHCILFMNEENGLNGTTLDKAIRKSWRRTWILAN